MLAGLLSKAIPWKDIILWAGVIGIIFAVVLYIKNAEENRTEVTRLEQVEADLKAANEKLVEDHTLAIAVLTENFESQKIREAEYEDNIEQIRALPDGDCVRSSAPILESIRLRRERATSGNN